MNIKFNYKLTIYVVLLCMPGSILAWDYSFKSFGTASLAQQNVDDVDFLGVGSQVAFHPGSKIAGQLNLDLSNDISLTYQGRIGSTIWEPEKIVYTHELAFIAYQPFDLLKLRLGRLRTPFFLNSEFIDTDFLLPWVRSPVTVYGQLPMHKYEGADALVYLPVNDDIDIELQFSYGRADESVSLYNPAIRSYKMVDFKAEDFVSISGSLFYQDWTIRFNYSQADTEVENPPSVFIPSDAIPDGDKIVFKSIGLKYEDEDYLLMAEYASRRIEDAYVLEPVDGFYITAGYKFNQFMPSLTYGQSTTPDSISRSIGQVNELSFISANIRWQLSDSMDIKFDFSRYYDDAKWARINSYIPQPEGKKRPKSIDLITISASFIY